MSDLTQKRDSECIPMAQELYQKLAKRADTLVIGDMRTDQELRDYYQQIFTEDISEVLVAHNAKVTDIEYVFTIMLQVIMNIKKAAVEAMKLDIEEVSIKATREIFKVIEADASKLMMGNDDEKETNKFYSRMCAKEILNILKDTNMDYVFNMMTQVVNQMHSISTNSLSANIDKATAKRWTVDTIDDLRVLHVTNELAGLPMKPEFKEAMGYPQSGIVDKK